MRPIEAGALERGDLGLERVARVLELPDLGAVRAVLVTQRGDSALQLGDPVPVHDRVIRGWCPTGALR